jgi:diguanylate cyclase (GGDEF)-like protein
VFKESKRDHTKEVEGMRNIPGDWSDEDERQWQTYQEGIHLLYTMWRNRAIETIIADDDMVARIPPRDDPAEWLRDHLEAHRSVFCGSPRDPEALDASRGVGFAHIRTHVLPSWYVEVYSLLFVVYLSSTDNPASPSLPRLSTVRRRWVEDVKVTLDTYDVVVNAQITRLSDLALTDPLTGILNRRGFWERVQHDAASRIPSAAFVLMDLDHFKRVNDGHGHPYGDEVLQTFARLGQSLARTGDAFARLGGDEFAWWVADVPRVQPLVERLQRLAASFAPTYPARFSAGVSWYPRDGDSPDTLYHHADVALYRAKESGRQCCAVVQSPDIYHLSHLNSEGSGETR